MDKIFAEGLYFDPPRQNAPDFVKGQISVKIGEFIAFLEKNQDGDYMRFDIKESKGGKTYIELNTWKQTATPHEKPKTAPETTETPKDEAKVEETHMTQTEPPFPDYPQEDIDPASIPF